MQILKKLLFLLTPRERKYSYLLLLMIIIMALLDMIGVASILPFMAVLSSPELINTNIILNTSFKASSIFGVKNEQHFIFVLGVLVFILLILSLAFFLQSNKLNTTSWKSRLDHWPAGSRLACSSFSGSYPAILSIAAAVASSPASNISDLSTSY